MPDPNPFAGIDLEEAIRARARASQLALGELAVADVAAHAREVLQINAELHLTSITEPEQFVERHIGEAFEGAALLDPGQAGLLVDLGSGNGYPGLPLAIARPALRLLMVEASPRKAAFLRAVAERTRTVHAEVLDAQVQRPADLAGVEPIRVLVTRAVGGWEKILPRLAPCLAPEGELLVWAGARLGEILDRQAWRRLRLIGRHPLPGLDQSWIWRLRSNLASRS